MHTAVTDQTMTECPVQAPKLPASIADPLGRRDNASAPGLLSRAKRWFGPAARGRVVDIGWTLRQTKASFIWDAPRPVLNKGPRSSHAKIVSVCPAMLDHESRLIEVDCPIDARIRFQRDAQGRAVLENVLGDASPIRSGHLSQMVKLLSEKEWRHPRRPIVQVITPYLFLADEPVWLTQLPPMHAYLATPWPGLLISGRFPIDVWPRTLMWAFEWYDTTKDLVLKRAEPWFTVRLETMDPSRKTRLVKTKLTPELEEYLQGLDGVSNYVRGTFGLFDVARRRRPKILLAPE
ncbi:MAG: hypothetical protein QOF90_3698 [Acetobacteraceae bacterium]|jgi:hypothetical protein|nr:hypothetical protein [Acetobacteraceae bacterium]